MSLPAGAACIGNGTSFLEEPVKKGMLPIVEFEFKSTYTYNNYVSVQLL